MEAEQLQVKTSIEEKLMDFDWSKILLPGETILEAPLPVLTSDPPGLNIMGPVLGGARVQGLYKGGVTGTTYTVSCIITTNVQKLEGCGDLYIAEC